MSDWIRRNADSLMFSISTWFVLFVFMVAALPQVSQAALLNPGDFNITGRLRNFTALNTQDLATDNSAISDQRHRVSMVRNSLWLEGDIRWTNWLDFGFVFRGTEELNTQLTKDLDAVSAADVDASYYDEADVRELFADIDLAPGMSFRVGKQQLVFGKSDFFQGLDLVHGRDLTWRLFLQPNEEWRKPNWMIRGTFELDTSLLGLTELTLEPYWIPGFDSDEGLVFNPGEDDFSIGKTIDLQGGRWAPSPVVGVCVTCVGAFGTSGIPYNLSHPEGDESDGSYGVRATGLFPLRNYISGFSDMEIGLSYMHTFLNGPFDDFFVVNSGSGLGSTPFKQAPAVGPFGAEFIFPEIDVFGINANTYYAPWDTVFRTEIAYTLDKPYNTNPLGVGIFGTSVVEKDVFSIMLGVDWGSVNWTVDYLGTYRPSTITLQIFDEWIPAYTDDGTPMSRRLVDIPGDVAEQEEHTTIATIQVFMHYWNDNLNPTLFAGWQVNRGGGFIAPILEYRWGTHWRFELEGDFFFEEETGGTNIEGEPLFGALDNKNQILTRVTYQF